MKKIILFLIAVSVFCSCTMQKHYVKMDNLLASGDCAKAGQYIQNSQSQYGQNSKLVYLMDSAMVNMMCGNYEESNHFYHDAESLGEKLWTKSVSQFALSMVTNDLVIPYPGEDFERAMINLFSAVCYLRLGEYDEALVECRRLDSLLTLYNSKYEKKNIYKEDAFARYLSGMIREAVDDLDGAYIDYYKALKTYKNYGSDYGTPTPVILKKDLLRIAGQVGRKFEAEKLVSDVPRDDCLTAKDIKGKGKIVFIHFNGKSPVKVENKYVVQTKSGPVSIAFPKYVVNPIQCRDVGFMVKTDNGMLEVGMALGEDINKIAVKSLDDRKARIWAKAVARAVAKQVAINKAAESRKNKDGERLMKMILNTANTLAVERADTRTWRTLPGEINIGRIFVPEGSYDVFSRGCGGGKQLIEPLEIKAGETKFVVYFTRR